MTVITNTQTHQPGVCGVASTCPTLGSTLPLHYQHYPFINTSSVAQCVTVRLTTLCSGTHSIFSAAYLLWAIQRILFNPLDKPENEHVSDLNGRELAIMVPLVASTIWLGVYPTGFGLV